MFFVVQVVLALTLQATLKVLYMTNDVNYRLNLTGFL